MTDPDTQLECNDGCCTTKKPVTELTAGPVGQLPLCALCLHIALGSARDGRPVFLAGQDPDGEDDIPLSAPQVKAILRDLALGVADTIVLRVGEGELTFEAATLREGSALCLDHVLDYGRNGLMAR